MALQNIGAGNKDDAFYRYKMPKMITKIEGRGNGIKTNVVNMVDIAKALGRPASYTTKYFGCELGAQSKFDEKTGTSHVNGAHDTAKLAALLENFIKKYVQCYGCGNPETEVIITKSQMINLKCAACGFISDVDMRDKLTTFILKNPPEQKKGSKDKKAMRRAEKERLKEGEAADEEQKKLKKEAAKKKGSSGSSKTSTKKKSNVSDEEHSPTGSQADENEAAAAAADGSDDDDDVQWQTDTSAEAAKKRIQEQLNPVTASMVMLSTNEEKQKSAGGGGGGGHHARDCKENGWQQNDVSANQEVLEMDIEEKEVESESKKLEHDGSVVDNSVGRVFTNVYTRKRKVGSNHFDAFVSGENTSTLKDKKCGKTYCRNSWSKKWSKKTRLCEMADACDPTVSSAMRKDLVKTLKIVVQSSCARRYIVACLLNSVLRYMGKSRIRQDQLFAFFHSKSLSQVYSSCGIHFLQDSNFSLERGVCMIMGGNCSTPVFALDFSAVPFCFIHLHLSILLRGIRLSYILVALVMYTEEEDDGMIISSIDSEMTHSANVTLTSQVYGSGTHVSYVNSGAANLTGQNVHVRNSRNIQKRSSFRSKRGRPPSSLTARKLNGAMASNMFVARQNSLRPPSMAPGRELRSSAQRTNSTSSKQVKSALVALPRDADSSTCSANILVVESDRCYREQGATITLDVSAKKQWYLAIKAGGMRQYSVVAEKFMRPCSCNRFTHAIIWAADNGWKLEFSDRRDWLIFKELYKECSDRNVQVPVESCIPVPGVREVPLCENRNGAFMRPASYITVKEDELVRALTSRAANYDMDSDDEEWINKYNNELSAENNSQMILSDEIFELIIDAFERGFHCNPDDYSDEMVVPSIGLNLEKRILEAVYGYWIKKRKQKRSALVRVFQYYQPRRSQVIPKSVLRKKRSFKRQGSRAGRGKQRSFLHAMAAERDVGGKQNAILKVEEAKAAANRSTELAVVKRERAQLLMQNADLLTYKATMAVRIAELARIAKSTCGDDLSQVAAGSPEAIVGLCSDKQ